MARLTYDYMIRGTAARGQTWQCAGSVIGEFTSVPEAVIKDTFIRLTSGKRVEFGNPGAGCGGPYEITQLIITKARA